MCIFGNGKRVYPDFNHKLHIHYHFNTDGRIWFARGTSRLSGNIPNKAHATKMLPTCQHTPNGASDSGLESRRLCVRSLITLIKP